MASSLDHTRVLRAPFLLVREVLEIERDRVLEASVTVII
jgi:hypothetical protein